MRRVVLVLAGMALALLLASGVAMAKAIANIALSTVPAGLLLAEGAAWLPTLSPALACVPRHQRAGRGI
jgi:hypothetical protein